MLHRRHKRLFLEQTFIFCRYFVYGTVIFLLLGMAVATTELGRLVHPKAQAINDDTTELNVSPESESVPEGLDVLRRG